MASAGPLSGLGNPGTRVKFLEATHLCEGAPSGRRFSVGAPSPYNSRKMERLLQFRNYNRVYTSGTGLGVAYTSGRIAGTYAADEK